MAVGLSGLEVEHLHGPTEITLGEDELVVVCLVRDGEPWIEAFVEHYFSLGARHLVFLDNGSVDATVSVAAHHDNVTVLRSTLPFKSNELLLRQYMISRFGQGRWSLCVDVDEFFDYPYSDAIGLDSLLGYLNGKSYTAVAAQMLDMFPEGPLNGQTGESPRNFRERHNLYDLSALKRKNLEKHSGRNNVFHSADIDCFAGGIRETVFGVRPRLTKFPLVFSDGAVKPVEESPHHIDNARVADFSCVLFHYKYVGRFHEQTVRAVREENHWNDSAQYKQYLEVLDRYRLLSLKRDTSQEMTDANKLLDEQFLAISEDYVSWVDAEEESRARSRSGEHEWSEVLLQARRLNRVKTLRIQRLERRLRDLNREVQESARTKRRLRRRVRTLKERIEGARKNPEAGTDTV
jgi:hypothetical protein